MSTNIDFPSIGNSGTNNTNFFGNMNNFGGGSGGNGIPLSMNNLDAFNADSTPPFLGQGAPFSNNNNSQK